MRRYPEYKDSGVTWLEEVPSHWRIGMLKHAAIVNPSKTASGVDKDSGEEVAFLPMEAVSETGRIDASTFRPIAELWSGFTYFEEGDAIVAKITPCFENGKGAFIGDIGSGIGFGSTEFHVLRPREGVTEGRFLYYLTYSHAFRSPGEAFMTGAAGQKRVPTGFVEEYQTALPSIEEQRAIATFLDRKTEQIDTLIRKKQRLIELLKEQRTALINRAVTKGLDPNVPMKDSGIEWLGEVPEHWEMTPLKRVTKRIVDCKNRTPPYVEDGRFLVVRTSNVRDGKFFSADAMYTDEESFSVWTQRGVPRPGDVLFTREAPAGEACLVPSETPLCLGQRMMFFRPLRHRLKSEFLVHSIYGPLIRQYISSISAGSTVSHIRVGQVQELPVLVPPISEQQQIVTHLNDRTNAIDGLAEQEQVMIDRLAQMRTSLISEVVTGKIDVRDHPLAKAEADVDAALEEVS